VAHSVFTRPDATYDIAPGVIEGILADETSPLNRIASTLAPGSTALDVGAGNGLLARVLAARGTAVTIDGLEPSPYAAELARPHYRHFHAAYVQERLEDIAAEGYDYLILADVIEHLADPGELLGKLAAAASPTTRILISTPNVAFGAVRVALLDGRFDYVDSGLLERTHLRFFTHATLLTVFRDAGLSIEREVRHCKHLTRTEIPVRRSVRNLALLWRLRREELALTYQFFFVLRPAGAAAPAGPPERYGRQTSALDLLAWLLLGAPSELPAPIKRVARFAGSLRRRRPPAG
jgi:2-polyprenyl-3-methyl-5-hydroxy-6-metoxy-1,4-benzoquinol methylase